MEDVFMTEPRLREKRIGALLKKWQFWLKFSKYEHVFTFFNPKFGFN